MCCGLLPSAMSRSMANGATGVRVWEKKSLTGSLLRVAVRLQGCVSQVPHHVLVVDVKATKPRQLVIGPHAGMASVEAVDAGRHWGRTNGVPTAWWLQFAHARFFRRKSLLS